MRGRGRMAIAAAALLALAVIGSALAASGSRAAKAPIIIGWAFDSSGPMAPFDTPALAAAKLRVSQLNAKGGVNGRKLQIRTCDTQQNKADVARACALRLLGQKANVIFTTCDVDLAAPVVSAAINRGTLAVAPCIGTDQMGPKRFGSKGRLAFSFGNVAQDEGSAMAQYAYSRGWRTADLATDTVIVYFKDVVRAFEVRFKQLGGRIVAKETYQSLGGSNNVQNAVNRRCVRCAVDARERVALAREQHADPQLVGRRRHLLAACESEGDQLLVRHVRVVLRRRPECGGEQAG